MRDTKDVSSLSEVRSARNRSRYPPLKNAFSLPAFININCTSEIKGEYGQTSVLECKISTSEEVKNAEITWLAWRKNGVQEPLLFYNNQNLEAKPGYSFAQQNWKKSLDVSLRIAHTKVQDEGVYTCQVATSGGKAEGPNWSRLYVTGESCVLLAAQLPVA